MKQILKSNIDQNWPLIEVDFKREIELFIDSFNGFNINRNTYKILYVKEQNAISNFKNEVIRNWKLFDLILTYDNEILEKCTNAKMMLFGTSWIHDYKFIEKKFQISHLVGHKNITKGHILRHEIYYKQNKIKNPIDFYISKYGGVKNINNNKILGEHKEPLFNSQFHICIENVRQENYFTEKLIDCFVTKTIPIYYGAQNIGNYFDLNGIYVVNNFKDILNVCNSINEDTYNEKKYYIESNYNKCLEYVDLKLNLKNKLKQLL